jgi:hypothetical protein
MLLQGAHLSLVQHVAPIYCLELKVLGDIRVDEHADKLTVGHHELHRIA